MNSFERMTTQLDYTLVDGTISITHVDSDRLAEDRAEEVAIAGLWEKYARPGFEESARQIAEIAQIDQLHEEAFYESDMREDDKYWDEQDQPIAEGVMHGPYNQDPRDFYGQHNGLIGAINESLKSSRITDTRADALKNNAEGWLIDAYNQENEFDYLRLQALDENAQRDWEAEELKQQEEQFRKEEEARQLEYGHEEALWDDFVRDEEAILQAQDHENDIWDEEDACGGCGEHGIGCVCAEIESFRQHNADPNTRGSYWTP